MIHELTSTPVVARDGFVLVPDAPGLGLDISMDVVEKHAKSG